MDGARQIVTPAFVSLLCICIVFVPMFFLEGVPRYLFVPMAEAVMFAMISSFFLSRTLVPTMANYLLRPHPPHAADRERAAVAEPDRRPPAQLRGGLRRSPRRLSRRRSNWRWSGAPSSRSAFLAVVAAAFLLTPYLGRNFFPSVDSGQILMHVRAARRHARRGERQAVLANRGGDPRRSSRRRSSPRWSTTSACRSAASISPTTTPA